MALLAGESVTDAAAAALLALSPEECDRLAVPLRQGTAKQREGKDE